MKTINPFEPTKDYKYQILYKVKENEEFKHVDFATSEEDVVEKIWDYEGAFKWWDVEFKIVRL